MAHHLNPKLGIWHTTTLQAAKEQQKIYAGGGTSLAGQKRARDVSIPVTDQNDVGTSRKKHQGSGGNLLKGPPRLRASRIEYADGFAGRGLLSEYSQRQAFAATPTSTADPLLSLSHPAYGLPRQLVANFAALGIKSIYPWQRQCLLGPGLLQGEKNLVYSAPTGGGKSLVADVLMLKRVLGDRDAKAILVLPYVALVQEKVRWLRNAVNGISRESLGQKQQDQQKLWAQRADRDAIRVVGFFGGSKIRATWADFDIAVCTIEKVSAAQESKRWQDLTASGKLFGKCGHRRVFGFQATRCGSGRVPHDRRRLSRLSPRASRHQVTMP
jgi:DNA polymerase theta